MAQVWGRGERGAERWIGSKLDFRRFVKGFQKECGRIVDHPVFTRVWRAKERNVDTRV